MLRKIIGYALTLFSFWPRGSAHLTGDAQDLEPPQTVENRLDPTNVAEMNVVMNEKHDCGPFRAVSNTLL